MSTKTKVINKYYLEGVYVKEIADGGLELTLVNLYRLPSDIIERIIVKRQQKNIEARNN
ncbi:hypothetical protein QUB80_01805 [Chlorogloeopsis sp. ULAP01]|nr:hypothetical protein [Chlorogloeopsis sp. ULAP01]